MSVVLVFLFGATAALAAGFVAVPLSWPAGGKSGDAPRFRLAALAGLLIVGLGAGTYLALGQPQLALRTLRGPQVDDFPGLIAALADHVRGHPDDGRGWALLGRGYMAVGDTDEAVKALARAIELAKAQGNAASPSYAELLSAYGEALTETNDGTVTPQAEAVFRQVLAVNPKDPAARYYLGLADRARGQTDEALQLWQALLADAPADAPWRANLIDDLTALKAEAVQRGAAPPPDAGAMVESLAARLQSHPGDFAGWTQLIRSYVVMGDPAKAKAALARARAIFAADAGAQRSLTALARDLSLERP